MMEIIGTIESDTILDHMSIFEKTIYSVDGYYLNLDQYVGKKVRITIEEV
jgi:hypothetical protein